MRGAAAGTLSRPFASRHGVRERAHVGDDEVGGMRGHAERTPATVDERGAHPGRSASGAGGTRGVEGGSSEIRRSTPCKGNLSERRSFPDVVRSPLPYSVRV